MSYVSYDVMIHWHMGVPRGGTEGRSEEHGVAEERGDVLSAGFHSLVALALAAGRRLPHRRCSRDHPLIDSSKLIGNCEDYIFSVNRAKQFPRRSGCSKWSETSVQAN